jgi:hypothetical protein
VLHWAADVRNLQHIYLCELFQPDIVHMQVVQHVWQQILNCDGLLDGGSSQATTAAKEVLHLHQHAN